MGRVERENEDLMRNFMNAKGTFLQALDLAVLFVTPMLMELCLITSGEHA